MKTFGCKVEKDSGWNSGRSDSGEGGRRNRGQKGTRRKRYKKMQEKMGFQEEANC